MTAVTEKKAKKPYFGFTGGWLTFWLTVACATDMTLFGYDQAVFSGVVVTQNFLELHDLVGPSKTTALSTVSAIYDIGCFVGALTAFTIGERLGRKKTVMIGTCVMSTGAILQASSYSYGQMMAGRIIAGIGNGINTSTAPVWQTETSPAKWRGKLVILEMWLNIGGFCLVNWINYGISFAGGSVAWRFPLAFQFIFIVVIFATVPWLPESPRWLIAHEEKEEALAVLAAIEGKEEADPVVATQMQEITYSVNYEREHAVSWGALIRGKKDAAGDTKTFRRLILGAGTQFMQQFGGINIVSYYLPTVFIEAVGLSNRMSRLLVACNSVSYLIASGAAVTVIERWGRRGLMFISTIGQFISFLLITILLRYSEEQTNGDSLAKASIFFFFFYFFSFGIGMLGVPWLYPTEINSLPMRTKGAAVATSTNWITNFVIVEITPIGIQNLGWRFWIVFTVFNAVFLPVIWFLYPETANRSLEDLDDYYRSNPPVIVTKDVDATSTARPLRFREREDEEIRQIQGGGKRTSIMEQDASNEKV